MYFRFTLRQDSKPQEARWRPGGALYVCILCAYPQNSAQGRIRREAWGFSRPADNHEQL